MGALEEPRRSKRRSPYGKDYGSVKSRNRTGARRCHDGLRGAVNY